MREVVLDTETTGLDPASGHRIVEIGCVELLNHLPSGRVWHEYFNPERPMPKEAFEVHGLSDDFLRDKPLFAEKVDSFLAFIADATLVIHNAPFDLGFLNAELARLGRPPLPEDRVIDTLALARRKHPGSPANLDALCRRYRIDNSSREKHGALLDSELLAEVYVELIGGHQARLELAMTPGEGAAALEAAKGVARDMGRIPPRMSPLPPRLTDAEIAAHEAFLADLEGEVLWQRYLDGAS